jgi:phenylacetate-CoA ligase
VQTELDRLLVRIVPGKGFSDIDRATLVRGLKERLGSGMRVDVELIEELPRTTRGKFRWVINELGSGL